MFMEKPKLMQLYEKCFDEVGDVRVCGRAACSELIKMCKKVAPGTDFGDEEAGFMNIANIKQLIALVYE